MNSSLTTVERALALSQKYILSLTEEHLSAENIWSVFSPSFDRHAALLWLDDLVANNFADFPEIIFVSTAEIDWGQGAYSANNNTIYLATEFVARNFTNPNAVSAVILEEFGHFLDAKFNILDTPGDEGELFVSLLQGRNLSEQQLAGIRQQDDRRTVMIDGRPLEIEQANFKDNLAFDLIGLTKLRNDPEFADIDGTGFSVAVIDTGIDATNPLLAPNYLAGYDFIDSDNDPRDPNGHGTHVAGIIGATNESIGIAPDVGLIALRVLDLNGNSFLSQAEASLKWVFDHRAEYNITAVNLSLGSGYYTPGLTPFIDVISDDIERLEAAGVTVVAATGNDYFANAEKPNRANINFPAIASTLAVGAVWQGGDRSNAKWGSGSIDYTTGADRIASFSQRLTVPKMIFAPGTLITSTARGSGVYRRSGTSQAAPHVAGAVALLQEAAVKYSGKQLAPAEVAEILRTTGKTIIDGDDEDDNVTNTNDSYRRIDLYSAVSEVKRRGQGTLNPEDLVVKNGRDLADSDRVYRFFNLSTGVHFYTASESERDSVIEDLPHYSYEGGSFSTPQDAADAVPVYRLYNANTGGHLYTISEAERDSISNNTDHYSYEGVAYHGYESDRPGRTALYRFYNSSLDIHFFTPNSAERDAVLANLPNYQLEGQDGVAFYVEPLVE